ncbi:MAG: hypothetical protein WCZ48_01915 [Bacillota bacterium]|nr:hypothetical protein [Bacillota bacterium]NLH86846.1 hypothetical protein [Bacillota bacterium]
MTRARVLRGIAIVAVLLMASMTTGCFKTEITISISPDELVCAEAEPFDGTITVEMVGWLAGGVYDTLTVEFFGAEDQELLDEAIVIEDLWISVSPVNKVATAELLDLEGLVAPAELWDEALGFVGKEAKFTLTSTGMNVKLNPLTCTVGLKDLTE